VFELYGFEPIETPAMENMETLTGKYGEEGDKLLFKILNSGDYLKDASQDMLTDSRRLAAHIAEKGLRYDLTVPLARYVVMHRHEITFPFKRYQIQPVWRADRPQKGRYREFWQCDADVIGSDALVNEAELLMIYAEVFRRLQLGVTIRINHRGVLEAIAAKAMNGEMTTDQLIRLIDKLDKAGSEAVITEAGTMSLSAGALDALNVLVGDFGMMKSNDAALKGIRAYITGTRAEREILELLTLLDSTQVRFDPTLGRGLDYYTGTIMEVVANDVQIGSIGGGGRYDNLTGVFGLDGVSGVGISFGLERINDVMEELGLFESLRAGRATVLVTWFDKNGFDAGWMLINALRAEGISSVIYPDEAKMSKQMKYADAKSFKHVIVIGDEELKSGMFTVKDMQTGEQVQMSKEELLGTSSPLRH
jgi:histidyl-tRNA synthetase